MEDSYTLNFEKMRKKIQIKDVQSFHFYLNNIFYDICTTDRKTNHKYVEKVLFIEYMNIPYIIGEKLFKIFNKEKKIGLDMEEFVKGIISLYSGSLEEIEKMIFNLLDFDLDGIILQEDARLLIAFLKNLAINPKSEKKIKKIFSNSFKNSYTNEEEFKQINEFVNSFFMGKPKLNFEEFKNYISTQNSDIFLLFMYFLYNNKPFKDYSIKFLDSLKIKNNNIDNGFLSNEDEGSSNNKIISPSSTFVEIIEDITYFDVNELSNFSDRELSEAEEIDQLANSTNENAIVNKVPYINPNFIKIYKEDCDFIRCNTKNLEIFDSIIIRKSKENFKKRIIETKDCLKNLNLVYTKKSDCINESTLNNINDNFSSNLENSKFSRRETKKQKSLHNQYSLKIMESEDMPKSSNQENQKINDTNKISPFLRRKSDDVDFKSDNKLGKEIKNICNNNVDRSLTLNNNAILPKIEIFLDIEKNNKIELKEKDYVNENKINKKLTDSVLSKNSMNSIKYLSPKTSTKRILENNFIEKQGYLFKPELDKKLTKFFAVLIGTDIYFFTSSNKNTLKGLHNINGTFITKNKNTIKVNKNKNNQISNI